MAERPPTTVQTVILSKTVFKTAAEARRWVREHDFHARKIDETETSYRFRQRDPGDFRPRSLRTKQITRGVSIVTGHLK
jgi:hypothetical protein